MSDELRRAEIKKLQDQIKKLSEPISPIYAFRGAPRKPGVAAKRKQPRTHQRSARVVLPGNYGLTTLPGSLYSTLLLVIGALGKLDMQEVLFANFQRQKTTTGARELLDEIGVSRAQAERRARGDRAFKAYAASKTTRLKSKAATGDKDSVGILRNPNMCNSQGRWIGDINEAVNILRGARTQHGLETLKNVRILRRARSGKNSGLMFDTSWRGRQQYCFLYPQKFHALFRQARALVGE